MKMFDLMKKTMKVRNEKDLSDVARDRNKWRGGTSRNFSKA